MSKGSFLIAFIVVIGFIGINVCLLWMKDNKDLFYKPRELFRISVYILSFYYSKHN